MSSVRTVIVSLLLAGVGIGLAAWGPGTEPGYADVSIGLVGGTMIGAALAVLASQLGWSRGRPSRSRVLSPGCGDALVVIGWPPASRWPSPPPSVLRPRCCFCSWIL